MRISFRLTVGGILPLLLMSSIAAAAERAKDHIAFTAPETKTLVLHDRYIAVPWAISQTELNKIAELFPDETILGIAGGPRYFTVSLTQERLEPSVEKEVSARAVVVDAKSWAIGKTGDRFRMREGSSTGSTGEDMRIWKAFEGLAWRTAKANGVWLSRSERIFFVPGESFRMEEGRIKLKYFKGFWLSKVGNTGMSEFAAIEIGRVQGLAKGSQQEVPADADKPRR